MDGYELRKHIGNITELLSEILVEIKGLREDGKAYVGAVSAELPPLSEDAFEVLGFKVQTEKGDE